MNMPAPPGITKLTYYYQCGVPGCKAETEDEHTLWHGAAIPWAHPPEGWRFLQGFAVCPDHRIEILSGTDHSDEMWIVEGESHWSTQESADRAEQRRAEAEEPLFLDRRNPENFKMRNSGALRPEKVEP